MFSHQTMRTITFLMSLKISQQRVTHVLAISQARLASIASLKFLKQLFQVRTPLHFLAVKRAQ